jgi:hypothetical protein
MAGLVFSGDVHVRNDSGEFVGKKADLFDDWLRWIDRREKV